MEIPKIQVGGIPKKGELFIHGDDEPELVVPLKDKSEILGNTHFIQEQLDKWGKAIENACKQGINIKINLGDINVKNKR